MGSEPVTVWVATDANGSQWVSREQPKWIDHEAGYDLRGPFDGFDQAIGINVPPGQCREYVLIPADEYSQPTADLSPVAKLIAELAHAHYICADAEWPSMDCAVGDATEIVAKSIEAARKIEGKADA